MRQPVGILGIEVVQLAVRGECVVDPVADSVSKLGFGHPAMQGECRNEMDVVDACGSGNVEYLLDDPAADVGGCHRRQGQRDVVERNRQLHAGPHERSQRLAVAERVRQRLGDFALGIAHRIEGLVGIHHTAADGQPLQAKSLAVVEHDRRGRPVDFEDETLAGSHRVPPAATRVRRSRR